MTSIPFPKCSGFRKWANRRPKSYLTSPFERKEFLQPQYRGASKNGHRGEMRNLLKQQKGISAKNIGLKQTIQNESDAIFGAQWRAVQREAQLAAEQAAHGVTVLGRANHAQPGSYTQAFFGLSIGLERMGKLIFLADHAIRNGGDFPTDQDLRKIGHDLTSLLARCEVIGAGLSQERDYGVRPSDAIHRGIENALSLFATKLRYYNLNHLAGVSHGQEDPVALWWDKVATPICNRHYSQRQRAKDERRAAIIENILGDSVSVMHITETGEQMRDVHTFFARAGATRVVQKYGRLYTLQIVRWLASIIFELTHRGVYEKRIESLFGLHEPFAIFLNEDRYLRDRKTWSMYH